MPISPTYVAAGYPLCKPFVVFYAFSNLEGQHSAQIQECTNSVVYEFRRVYELKRVYGFRTRNVTYEEQGMSSHALVQSRHDVKAL